MGIGIGHGNAVAGQIGSQEQIKIGVFGPVVNLASRLQDLTKAMGVPILIDEATAITANQVLAAEEGYCRWVACLCPAGVETHVNTYALIPGQDDDLSMTGEQLRTHEAAVQAVVESTWDQAKQLLEDLPLTDGPSSFLRSVLASLVDVPDDWDGAINMEDKTGHKLLSETRKKTTD